MGPIRTEKRSSQSSSKYNTNSKHKHKHLPRAKKGSSESASFSAASMLGVQRLKASLRQTCRLLAKVLYTSPPLLSVLYMFIIIDYFCKDTLAPNVRVETERRLKSLEADIAEAQSARRERALALRYHKVKFFGA